MLYTKAANLPTQFAHYQEVKSVIKITNPLRRTSGSESPCPELQGASVPAPTPHQAQPPPDPTRGEQSPPEGSRALLPDSPCAELQPLLSETYLGFRPLIPASRLLLITLPCRSREQVNEGKGVYFPIRLLSWLSCIFTHNRNDERRRKTGLPSPAGTRRRLGQSHFPQVGLSQALCSLSF